MKKRRIYVDTSVFGGCFDDGFGLESLALIDRIRAGDIEAVVSDVLERELMRAPEHVFSLLQQIDRDVLHRVIVDDRVRSLAEEYIADGVLTRKSYSDALHVAAATFAEVDAIVSWNFKHLANINRIDGFNRTNKRLGLASIDIRSPWEFYDDEQ